MNRTGAKFLLWCSGANVRILERPSCATVREIYQGIGAAVLLTAVFAGVGMAFMLSRTFSVAVGLAAGVAWAVAIFNTDRLLLASVRRRVGDRLMDRLIVAVPRIVLALLIAAAIAEPLLVEMFRADVQLQLAKDNLAEQEAAGRRIAAYVAPELSRLEVEEVGIRLRRDRLDSAVTVAYRAATNEADGIAGSMIQGRGGRWSEKLDRYRQLRGEQDALVAATDVDLTRLRLRRERILREKDVEVARIRDRAEAAQTFLRQHAALKRLMEDREVGGVVAARANIFRALFLVIELLPLLVKLMLPRTAYDAALDKKEDESVRRLQARKERRRKVLDARSRIATKMLRGAEQLAADALDRMLAEPDTVLKLQPLTRRIASGTEDLIWTSIWPVTPPPPSQDANRNTKTEAWTPPDVTATREYDAREPSSFFPAPSASQDGQNLLRGLRGYSLRTRRAITTRLRGTARQVWGGRLGRLFVFAIVTAISLGSVVAVLAWPYWTRPCRSSGCPVSVWVERSRQQTEILDRRGELYGVWPGEAPVSIESLPPYVTALLQAVEDKRFRSHSGVDVLAVAAAFASNVRGRPRRGASTISQQAIRCLDRGEQMWEAGGWRGKIAEARAAIDLERRYSKDEILSMYFNCIDLGWVAGVPVRGVSRAAKYYFGVPATHLSLAQAATLVGMLKGPMIYHPLNNPERAVERRNVALRLLASVYPEFRDSASSAIREPLATMGRERIVRPSAVLALIGATTMSRDQTLPLHTTLDLRLQRAVEGEIRSLIGDLEGGNHGRHYEISDNPMVAGGLVMRAATGEILAYECGRPNGLEVSWDPCSKGRIVMSSVVKVFLVAAALESGAIRPDDALATLIARSGIRRKHSPTAYVNRICDQSHPRLGWGIRQLLALSDNCLAVVIHQLLPPEAFVSLRDIGVALSPAQPATALGTATIRLLDLAALTAAIANGGRVPQWTFVQASDTQLVTVKRLPFSESTLSTLRVLLEDVVDAGTAALARAHLKSGARAFAKTGTGDQEEELLIVGGDARLVVMLWVGRSGARHRIGDTMTAGKVLGGPWGRLVSAAAESIGPGSNETASSQSGLALRDGVKTAMVATAH